MNAKWRDGGWIIDSWVFSDEEMLEMEVMYKDLIKATSDINQRKKIAELAAMNKIELMLESE